jgi:hypothetical protein
VYRSRFSHSLCFFADRTGLEPATSAVTGQHSNQLNYRSLRPFLIMFVVIRSAKIGLFFIQAKNKSKKCVFLSPCLKIRCFIFKRILFFRVRTGRDSNCWLLRDSSQCILVKLILFLQQQLTIVPVSFSFPLASIHNY